MIKHLLEFRKKAKMKTGYYDSLPSLQWPDGRIRPNFNHTATSTGRLSCSNPNLQNAAHGEDGEGIKHHFIPAPGYVFAQADFSQLEIITLAVLTGDTQLNEDINKGRDLHCVAAEAATGEPYERIAYKVHVEADPFYKEQRRQAKQLWFLWQYGGGANTLAKNTGLDQASCKMFLERLSKRYPSVEEAQKRWIRQVEVTASDSGDVVGGSVARENYLQCPQTKRRFYFKEVESPEWLRRRTGRGCSFSPTQIKNFPVQDVGTGDVVGVALGRLNKWLTTCWPNVRLVNTVHDSFLMEVPDDENLVDFCKELKEFLETTPEMFQDVFGTKFPQRLPVEVEVGDSWGDMKPLGSYLKEKEK